MSTNCNRSTWSLGQAHGGAIISVGGQSGVHIIQSMRRQCPAPCCCCCCCCPRNLRTKITWRHLWAKAKDLSLQPVACWCACASDYVFKNVLYSQQQQQLEEEQQQPQLREIKCNFYYALWFLLPALSFYKFSVLSCLVWYLSMACPCVCFGQATMATHTHTHTAQTNRLGLLRYFRFLWLFYWLDYYVASCFRPKASQDKQEQQPKTKCRSFLRLQPTEIKK